jgi:hypothetical protein
MRTCRLCGIAGSWDWQYIPWRPYDRGYEELCSNCNRYYYNFYRNRCYGRHDHLTPAKRDELMLTQFIADRLHRLAQRHAAGQPITRCQVVVGSERCSFYYSKEVNGHKLCAVHAKQVEQGRGRPIHFADDDAAWLDQVVKFFHGNFNLGTPP